MLGRIATNASVRQWTLAAAGLGIVIAVAIATAPRPTCRCPATRPTTSIVQPVERVAWAGPRLPCEAIAASHARTIASEIDQALACARSPAAGPIRAYLAAMRARQLDTDGAQAALIDAELHRLTPAAAEQFLAREDYQNAASAVLVGESLDVDRPAR